MTTISTSDVIVGARYRRDPGDLELLADSIRDVACCTRSWLRATASW